MPTCDDCISNSSYCQNTKATPLPLVPSSSGATQLCRSNPSIEIVPLTHTSAIVQRAVHASIIGNSRTRFPENSILDQPRDSASISDVLNPRTNHSWHD